MAYGAVPILELRGTASRSGSASLKNRGSGERRKSSRPKGFAESEAEPTLGSLRVVGAAGAAHERATKLKP